MGNFSQNLCFLLWQRQVPRADWAGEVKRWAGCSDEQKANELLSGINPSPVEVKAISQAVQIDEQELYYSDLLKQSQTNIWRQNVAYLVKTLKHGEKKNLAEHLGVKSSGTITKWKEQSVEPEKTYKEGLNQFFGLPSFINLEQDPLFLSRSPIDTASQRAWLHERIDQMSDRTLQTLFPALERLLRDP